MSQMAVTVERTSSSCMSCHHPTGIGILNTLWPVPGRGKPVPIRNQPSLAPIAIFRNSATRHCIIWTEENPPFLPLQMFTKETNDQNTNHWRRKQLDPSGTIRRDKEMNVRVKVPGRLLGHCPLRHCSQQGDSRRIKFTSPLPVVTSLGDFVTDVNHRHWWSEPRLYTDCFGELLLVALPAPAALGTQDSAVLISVFPAMDMTFPWFAQLPSVLIHLVPNCLPPLTPTSYPHLCYSVSRL